MMKTFEEVHQSMVKHSPHLVQMGRKSKCTIPDLISKGTGLLNKGEWDVTEDTSGETLSEGMTLEDIVVKLDI